MRLIEENTGLNIKWVVFTSNPAREKEARSSADHFLAKVTDKEVTILDYRDGFLPFEAGSIKNYFEDLKTFQPDVVFTHYRHDLHQDHRLVCDLTWNTFRNHLILEYEIPKYDGDLGNPNFFVPLQSGTADKKVKALLRYYTSQAGKHWFDEETFRALMRIRGVESVSKSRYAEAFYLRKAIV
jgi:LmbE family N-acetylglucosaminyl deacetylase